MSLKANTAANFLGQAWLAAMNLAFIPVYIQYLGMESYGLIGLLASLQAWLAFFDLGLTPTLNREMARFSAGFHSAQSIRNLLVSLEAICFGIAALFGIGLWGMSGYLAEHWLQADTLPVSAVSEALSFIALIMAFRFVEGIYRGALLGLQRQVWLNGVGALLAAGRSVGAVLVLAFLSPTAQAFFIWQVIFAALSASTLAIKVHLSIPKSNSLAKFSREAIAEVWEFARGMIGIGFAALVLSQVDKLLLSRLLTLESFGYFALAASVASLLHVMVGSVTTAASPKMVELLAKDRLRELPIVYHQGAQMVSVLTAPLAMLLFLFPEGAIYLWSGDAALVQHSAEVLSILAVGQFLNGLMWMPYQCQIAHGWTSLVLRSNLIGAALFVPAIFWSVPHYGAIGSAWAWALLNAGYIVTIIPVMHKKLMPTEMRNWYLGDVTLPFGGAFGVCFLSGIFRPQEHASRWDWFAFLLITGMLAFATSIALSSEVRKKVLDFRWKHET